MFRKVTYGFVVQEFGDNGKCFQQEFIAGDEVDYENQEGEMITPPKNEKYFGFDMVQPSK